MRFPYWSTCAAYDCFAVPTGCTCTFEKRLRGGARQPKHCSWATGCCKRHPKQCLPGAAVRAPFLRNATQPRRHWSVQLRQLMGLSALAGQLADRRGPPLFAINPCVLDQGGSHAADVFLVRITPVSLCARGLRSPHHERVLHSAAAKGYWGVTGEAHALLRENSHVAIWERGARAPLQTLHGLEDVRGVVAGGILWLIAGSFAGGDTYPNRQVLLRRAWPSLTPLSGPTELVWHGRQSPREKNWIPFVATSGQVLITYSLEPHVVLDCHATSGACTPLAETSSPLWLRRVSDFRGRRLLRDHDVNTSDIRGGSTCVPLSGRLVCAAHWHNLFASYWHFFYAMRPSPPFEITHVSYPFRFAAEFPRDPPDVNRDRIQFAVGLARSQAAPGEMLTLSYGVGDCIAAEANVTIREVQEMLEGRLLKLEL